MSTEINTAHQAAKFRPTKRKNIRRLKALGIVFTIFGVTLFIYFVYSVGITEIFAGIASIGFGGFAIILFIYFLRICVRATSWRLSVSKPHKLKFRDTLPAVIIGEALSSMIPLGILMSGTAKAVAVRKKIPLVVGLSSVATENLFYSLITGLFICSGAVVFLQRFELPEAWVYLIHFVIGFIVLSIILGSLMIIRQWNWASGICDLLFRKGVLTGILDSGRRQVRLFENSIYGFYRQYPKRFIPICLLQVLFHVLGIFEVWFILSRISQILPAFSTAYFLESISRLITIVFKLVPLLVGIDEAGAEFIVETLAIGVGIGVTLAIIRKGRILFWAGVGVIFIVKRGLSFREIRQLQVSTDE